MENSDISNHLELRIRISQLKAEQNIQKAALANMCKEFVSTLNPVTFVKSSLHTLATDKTVQFDLVKVGLNLGTNLIIDQTLGRYRSIKGFLSSVLLEKYSSSFINNNVSKIVSVIGNLVSGKSADKKINYSDKNIK